MLHKENTMQVLVLFLAGMEIIFFISACMVLHLRFVSTTMLTTRKLVSCSWKVLAQCQGHLCLSLWAYSEQTENLQEVGKGHSQADDLNSPKGYSKLYGHMISWIAAEEIICQVPVIIKAIEFKWCSVKSERCAPIGEEIVLCFYIQKYKKDCYSVLRYFLHHQLAR